MIMRAVKDLQHGNIILLKSLQALGSTTCGTELVILLNLLFDYRFLVLSTSGISKYTREYECRRNEYHGKSTAYYRS